MDTRGGGVIENPIVSVLLPTYRRAQSGFFERAVKSVLGQTFKNLELIIIDDASTDGTAKIIQSFMETDSRVCCIRHKYNVGLPAISEYEGFVKARGKYIAFVFDDNEWDREYLEKTIQIMEEHQVKAAYGRMYSYYDREKYVELGISSKKSIYSTNYIANGAVILAKEVLCNSRIGLYDPHVTMTRVCDWSLWKRVITQYEFMETGIFAGAEWGASRKDSIGNAYKMSSWSVAERETEAEPEEFLPENYLEIEINGISMDASDLYCSVVNDFYHAFCEKQWYCEEKINRLINESSRLRILAIAFNWNTKTNLPFIKLASRAGHFVFRFADINISIGEAAQADAVILFEDLFDLEKIRQICKLIRIPCFAYLNGNCIVINEKDSFTLEMIKKCAQYEGVIAADKEIYDFLSEKRVDNIYALDSSMNIDNCENEEKSLQRIFSMFHSASCYELIQRMALVGNRYDKLKSKSRSLTEVPLAFTGGISSQRNYYVLCLKEDFSELGICFASWGEARGNLRIHIESAAGEQRICYLNLENFVKDNWTYIMFDTIENTKNQIITITFNFEYASDSALVGVFEEVLERSFLDRFKKSEDRTKPKLFVDMR